MTQRLIARKPFPFAGRMLSVDEEFVPDNEAQAELLIHIGLAARKQRGYKTRVMRAERAAQVEPDAHAAE